MPNNLHFQNWRRRMRPLALSLIGMGLIALGACAGDEQLPDEAGYTEPDTRDTSAVEIKSDATSTGGTMYDFSQADAVFELPDELLEISDLTVLDATTLGAVQDETGILYSIDMNNGKVTDRVEFGKKGDYEGVEKAGDRLFVLQSDGVLQELKGWPGEITVQTYASSLKKTCDAEGLAYQASGNRLLISCKESPGKEYDGSKVVFAFDLATNRYDETPVWVFKEADLVNKGKKGFKPSALAVSPVDQSMYLLSSIKNAIAVMDPEGRIVNRYDLRDSGFEQPEGLTITETGDVFVSSEGVKGPGIIARFRNRARS